MPDKQPRATFKKEERLKSKKILEALFEKGVTADAGPLKLIWQITPFNSSFPAQAAFSAPKKKFPLATDRNRVKRQMREVYRLQKTELYNLLREKEISIAFIWIYTGRQKPMFHELQNSMRKILEKLKQAL